MKNRTVEMHGVNWELVHMNDHRRYWTGVINGLRYRIVEGLDWKVYVEGTSEPIGYAAHPSDGARMARYHAFK